MTLTRVQTTTADAAGAGAVTFTLPVSTEVWTVSQITVATTPVSAACTAAVTLDGLPITSTGQGSADTAIGPPSLTLMPSSQLVVTWANAPAGAQLLAVILYDLAPLP